MSTNTDSLTEKYHNINIDALILFGEGIGLDIFLLLGKEKLVKVCNKDDPSHNVLEKYQKRGIEDVYLLVDCYKLFIAKVKERLQQNSKQTPSIEEKNRTLSNGRDVLKTIFNEETLPDEAYEIAKSLVTETIGHIKRTNIFDLFKQFKESCSEEFLHLLLTSYLSLQIIDQNPWSNDAIKEKTVLGILLGDILLNKDDFGIIRGAKNKEAIPKHLIDHPINTVLKLQGDSKKFEKETLDIVLQHHERPNGKGFPKGLTYHHISHLTAITIVCNWFVEQLFDLNFSGNLSSEEKSKLFDKMTERYHSGSFHKTIESLKQIFV